jgi:hypothetical protein
MLTFEEQHTKLMQRGPRGVSPLFIPMMGFFAHPPKRFIPERVKSGKAKGFCYSSPLPLIFLQHVNVLQVQIDFGGRPNYSAASQSPGITKHQPCAWRERALVLMAKTGSVLLAIDTSPLKVVIPQF